MFRILTKSGAVERHQMTKEIAGADARRTMEANIKAGTQKVTSSWYGGRIDVADAKKTLNDYTRNYNRTAPESIDPEVKSTMWKRAKQLKDEFSAGMLSQSDLHPVKGINVNGAIQVIVDQQAMQTNRCVERNTEWYKKNATKIAEYKNIMRHLCPKDENASLETQMAAEKNFTDIEKFRPKGNGS